MTDLISVIIPVYNVESYIRECFDHLLNQEYQSFEVLVVDDGSTDTSGAICDEYADMDRRFKIWHTENKGIGAARNFAMDKMKGRYCFFLDPDDVLEEDSLSCLYSLIREYDADIVLGVTRQFCGPYEEVVKEEPVISVYTDHREICEKVLFDKNDMKPLEKKKEPSSVTYEFFSSLYRVDLLEKYHIRFLPISYGEDTYVCLKMLLNASCVVTTTQITYSHRRNPTSTTYQYHPFYLSETKKYYSYYMSLFTCFAPEYYKRARTAINGQYLRRCVSAMEREIFISPLTRTHREICATFREIRRDRKFSRLFTYKSIKYLGQGNFKLLLYAVKLNLYRPAVWLYRRHAKKYT